MQVRSFYNYSQCYIIDNAQRGLKYAQEEYGFVESYSIDASDAAIYLKEIAEELEDREQTVIDDDKGRSEQEILEKKPLLMFISDTPEIISAASKDKDTLEYISTIRRLSRYKAVVILGGLENAQVSGYGAPELGKRIVQDKRCWLFDDAGNSRMFDIPAKQVKLYGRPIRTGDAYRYADGSIVQKVHIAMSTHE